MNNIAQKYNRILILLFVFAPFVAFFTFKILNISFNRMMQIFSYIGVFLLLIIRDNRNPIRFPKYLLFYLLFIVYVFYSDLYRLGRDFKISYLFSNYLIGSFLIMFIIENLRISFYFYRFIIKCSKIILIIAVGVIIIQQVINPNFFMRSFYSEDIILITNSNITRLYSIYSWFGHIFSAGLSFVPIFILVVEDLDKRKKKIIIWMIMGLVFAFLTKQRWVMLNFLMVFIILLSNRKDRLKKIIRFIFVIPLIIGSMSFLLGAMGIDSVGILRDRIFESNKKNIDEKSAGTRILAFKAFNKLFWDYPIFGVGNIKYGMGGTGKQDYKLRKILKRRSSQIHVGYLSLLYMYGLVGGVFFLSFLYLLLKKLFKNAKKTRIWAPFIGILGFATDNLFDVNFQVFIMGLIIVLVADHFYSQKLKDNQNKYIIS